MNSLKSELFQPITSPALEAGQGWGQLWQPILPSNDPLGKDENGKRAADSHLCFSWGGGSTFKKTSKKF